MRAGLNEIVVECSINSIMNIFYVQEFQRGKMVKMHPDSQELLNAEM